MSTLVRLKKDLDFNVELVSLIDVMKGIAASEFQELQKRKEHFHKRFLESFASFFELIDFGKVEHPFGRVTTERMGIIMVTSDEGFMGGLNTHVINSALAERQKDAELIIIGERGAAYLKGVGEKFEFFPGITEENRYKLAVDIKNRIIQESNAGRIGKVILSYPFPISFTFQRVELVTILPCTELFEKKKDVKADSEEVILESRLEGIIEHLVAEWITHKLYEVFEDSKLSEFAARTIHLEQSYQELSQLKNILQYQYTKEKHSFIDRGMRGAFASQLLRKRIKGGAY